MSSENSLSENSLLEDAEFKKEEVRVEQPKQIVPVVEKKRISLIEKFAEKYTLDSSNLMNILKNTAFSQRDGQQVTNEQMAALLVVADQYGLNPFTKEIYAFPDKKNGIIPVVGVDGWSRIINSQPQLDGIEFKYSDEKITLSGGQPCYEWIECLIYRKDRKFPTVVREFLIETYRAPFEGKGSNGPYKISGPWQTCTARMLRHKALIQCARYAFGFGGIYDEDDAKNITESDSGLPIVENKTMSKAAMLIASAKEN
jgi:hypothetical protein